MTVPVRKAKRLITFAGATLLGAFPTSAQQVADLNQDRAAHLDAKCAKYEKSPALHAGCYTQEAINFDRARGVAADRRGAAADTRGAAAAEVSKCVDFLITGVRSGTFKKDEILKEVGGKLDDSNACPAAKRRGYERKADAAEALNIR